MSPSASLALFTELYLVLKLSVVGPRILIFPAPYMVIGTYMVHKNLLSHWFLVFPQMTTDNQPNPPVARRIFF